jgi:hypothetical protein
MYFLFSSHISTSVICSQANVQTVIKKPAIISLTWGVRSSTSPPSFNFKLSAYIGTNKKNLLALGYKWISCIKSFVMGGSVAVNVNEDVEHFFQTRKVLRQGDPLSPILFNIVSDMLAILIKHTKEEGQIVGSYHT